MSYTLSELTTALTADEVEAAIYAAVQARGAKTTAWKPGGVVRTVIAGVAIVLAAFSRLIALVSAGGFLDLATESWLTLVAQYVFGVNRLDGTFATGEVTLTNTSGTPYSGGADDLIVQNSTTGAEYRSTGAWSLAAGSPSSPTTATVEVSAVEIGADGTSPAGDIDTMVTTLSGVTVSNAAKVTGTDEETDPALRTRCLERTGPLSPNGPSDAYGYVARNATNAAGDSIGITRVATEAVGDGSVNVWLATATGEVTGTAGNPATDLGAVAADIYEQAEPLAVEAVVATATGVTVNVTYELWIYTSSGLTSAEIETLVSDALTALMSNTPIGGHLVGTNRRLYHDDIVATIHAVRSEIFRVEVTAPAADVTLAINEMPIIGTVSETINLVSGGDL
jgi:phage-related baseplate assembly protein